MNRISDDKLDNITGGNTTVNGPIINAIVNVINLLRDAGYSIGSGLRRIGENKMCPLE